MAIKRICDVCKRDLPCFTYAQVTRNFFGVPLQTREICYGCWNRIVKLINTEINNEGRGSDNEKLERV